LTTLDLDHGCNTTVKRKRRTFVYIVAKNTTIRLPPSGGRLDTATFHIQLYH
jgi:hypothetical protein